MHSTQKLLLVMSTRTPTSAHGFCFISFWCFGHIRLFSPSCSSVDSSVQLVPGSLYCAAHNFIIPTWISYLSKYHISTALLDSTNLWVKRLLGQTSMYSIFNEPFNLFGWKWLYVSPSFTTIDYSIITRYTSSLQRENVIRDNEWYSTTFCFLLLVGEFKNILY